MIDKTSMMNTNISALARQAADTHTTGLANPTGATALRQRLLSGQIPASIRLASKFSFRNG